jgi:hypothetical protein
MRISRRFVLQLMAVTSLGLLVGWGVSRYAKGSEKVIEVGDGKYDFDSPLEGSVPPQARLDQGQRLAVVVGISKFSQPSEYLGVLQRKYQHLGLKVLFVFSPDSPKAHTLLATAIGVPWVIDNDGQYQHLLRSALEHRHDAILIYDQGYKVKFQALAAPDTDLVRQLVEKYLIGEITYSPVSLLSSSLIGKRIEGLQCRSSHPPSKGVFVVFPPGCSSCQLSGYTQALKRARRSGWGSTNKGDNWTLVFVNGRDAGTLAAAENLDFDVHDVCGIREDSLLDPYQTRKSPGTEPLLLKADDNGIVTDVENLMALSNRSAK